MWHWSAHRVIELCAEEGCVQIDVSESGECSCYLIQPEQKQAYYLGIESLDYITEQLTQALNTPWEELPDRAVEGYGYRVKWVLYLIAGQTVLYIATEAAYRLLLWVDDDATLIYTMRLSQEQCSEWAEKLRAAANLEES
jgi:hypothetical protein